MLLSARQILDFTRGVPWEAFAADREKQYAVTHLIQIIGEAARKVSPEFRSAHPEIPWREVVGMRHRIVHEYFRIITSEVWRVVEKDLPALIPLLESLVPPEEPAERSG
jgi:uncharacterized protein with HEPN domain